MFNSDMIDEVKVYPQQSKKMLARGTFVMGQALKVNFVYLDTAKGRFVALPQDKVEKDGETKYYPHAKMINRDAIQDLNNKVEQAYNEAMKGESSAQDTPQSSSQNSSQKNTQNQGDTGFYDDDLPF